VVISVVKDLGWCGSLPLPPSVSIFCPVPHLSFPRKRESLRRAFRAYGLSAGLVLLPTVCLSLFGLSNDDLGDARSVCFGYAKEVTVEVDLVSRLWYPAQMA
jgi:hypothetical protein